MSDLGAIDKGSYSDFDLIDQNADANHKHLATGETQTSYQITKQEIQIGLAQDYGVDDYQAGEIADYLLARYGSKGATYLTPEQWQKVEGLDIAELSLLAKFDTNADGSISHQELVDTAGGEQADAIFKDLGVSVYDDIPAEQISDIVATGHAAITSDGSIVTVDPANIDFSEKFVFSDNLPISLILAYVFQNAKDFTEEQLKDLAEALNLNTQDTKLLNDILSQFASGKGEDLVALTPEEAQFLLDNEVASGNEEITKHLKEIASKTPGERHTIDGDGSNNKLTRDEFRAAIEGEIQAKGSTSSQEQTKIQVLNQDLQTFLQTITSLIKGHGERNTNIAREIK